MVNLGGEHIWKEDKQSESVGYIQTYSYIYQNSKFILLYYNKMNYQRGRELEKQQETGNETLKNFIIILLAMKMKIDVHEINK